MDKILILIPARGGSKGIPNKNIKKFNGKPLIEWTIKTALESKLADRIVVSSDSKKILNLSKKFNISLLKRPKSISGDKSSTESVVKHCLKSYNNSYKTIVLLPPTSPVRKKNILDNALKFFNLKKLDSCFSGSKLSDFLIWEYNKKNKKYRSLNYDFKKRGNRQSRKSTYVENGSIYIFKSKILFNNNNRIGGKFDIFKMSIFESFELDEKEDWKIIESIHKNYILNNSK
ncbi:acylneuraminate cytidylyltransferase family protein [Candidatus Pelagibacter sp. HIMB1782]|uniref:acylneuraminate cytidylyltransferase family protein n=1 Tax=Candidatus Pelagibacter sp. HIMB1782 TaxID=3413375 RepID=UPI003F872A02